MAVSARDEVIYQLRNRPGAFHTLANDLAAYYAFEENFDEEMNALDSVPPNANDLVRHYSQPFQNVRSAAGKVGKCVEFSPDYGFLTHGLAPDFTSERNTAFRFDKNKTLAFWIKFKTFEQADNAIFYKDTPGGNEYWLRIRSMDRALALNGIIIHPQTLETGIWYFVAVTYSTASGWTLAVDNGIPVTGNVGIIHSTSPFVLGANPAGDLCVDEFGMWDRVLTAAERTALYNNGLGLTYAEIVKATSCRSIVQTCDCH